MAGYDTTKLSLVNATVGGTFKEYIYLTTDSVATVLGAGYITDATKKGMLKGDKVTVVNQTTPLLYVAQVGLISAGAATLIGSEDVSSTVGFFGVTPVTTQPAATAQSAVATTAVTAVPTTAITTAVSTAVSGTFGFVTQAQGDAIVAAVNSLIARVALLVTAGNSLITQSAADVVLANQIRTDLIALGLIKGSA